MIKNHLKPPKLAFKPILNTLIVRELYTSGKLYLKASQFCVTWFFILLCVVHKTARRDQKLVLVDDFSKIPNRCMAWGCSGAPLLQFKGVEAHPA